jgi:S-adenosylmethionine synthetase
MKKFLTMNNQWMNPEIRDVEVVERKGFGHPDTLADGVAEWVSIAYARYCLERFGVVPHHNLDKVYIGAGHFTSGFGYVRMHKPVRCVINGRISNTMNGEPIPVEEIQERAAREYVARILPHLDPLKGLSIIPNATQHTLRDHWFTPRNRKDIPDANHPMANDTSLCVAHAPFTTVESLAFQLERSFWTFDMEGAPISPRWDDVGQDIKVMIMRRKEAIEVTVCVPLISLRTASWGAYCQRIGMIRSHLQSLAENIVVPRGYTVKVCVNPAVEKDDVHLYLLGTGSCVECGEEGVVGRGNPISGVISPCRLHTMEAPFGKNLVYHTGRVLGFLTHRLARALYARLEMPCSVYAVTENGGQLLPPKSLIVETHEMPDRHLVETIIEDEFLNVDYVAALLVRPLVWEMP